MCLKHYYVQSSTIIVTDWFADIVSIFKLATLIRKTAGVVTLNSSSTLTGTLLLTAVQIPALIHLNMATIRGMSVISGVVS